MYIYIYIYNTDAQTESKCLIFGKQFIYVKRHMGVPC